MSKIIFLFSILLFFISDSYASNLNSGVISSDSTFDIINFYSVDKSDTIFFRKINKDIPAISFEAILHGKDYIFFPVRELIIRDSASDKLIQKLDDKKDSLGIMNIEFNDFNFDGYLDLYLYDGCVILGNCYGKVFLFNREQSKFIRETAFDEMTSIYADKEKKIIRSFNQCCAGTESETRFYKYYDGKLSLVKEILKSFDNNKSLFNYTINEYDKDGKLIKTKKITSENYDLDLE